MDFQRSQTQFDSLGQWHAWRLGLDLAQPRPQATSGEQAYHRFYRDFLTDLFANPRTYGIPHAAYEPIIPGDKAREDRLREGRLKVRRAVELGLVDFWFQLGQVGERDGDILQVRQPFFDQLVAEKVKKTKITGLPQGFERLGISFTVGENVVISNPQYPGSLAALTSFVKACAAIPDYGFYFFRRCDFGVFDEKRLPSFEDGLALISEELGREVQRTDALLCERKFKRELFVGDADGGYRMRYQKKAGKIAYWSRIRSWSSIEHDHNLRWNFASDITPRLFNQLEAAQPGLAEQIFDGIKKCAHCYENCIVRAEIAYRGRTQEICQEVGWETADFATLRTVIGILDGLASQKK